MDELVCQELDLRPKSTRAGRTYNPPVLETGARYTYGVGVYWKRGAELNLDVFLELCALSVADQLRQRLAHASRRARVVQARMCPYVPCESLVIDWEKTRRQLIEPYFKARADLAAGQ
jgi:hypothetical protein